MRFRGLDLNLLVVLDALFETRSVTAAGERLHLSQSATSSALSRLRDHFGDELLVARRNQAGIKQMVPTAFGMSLADPVHLLLVELQATVDRQPVFDLATCAERIRILTPDYIEIALLAEVVRKAGAAAPNMSFEISSGGSNDDVLTALRRATADFIVVRPQHLAQGHPHLHLLRDTSVCIGCASHPQLDGPLSREAFLRLKRIELNKVHSDKPDRIGSDEMAIIRSANSQLKVDSMATIPAYLVGTEMVSVMPRILAMHFCKSWPVRYVPIESFDEPIEFLIQWNAIYDTSPARRWFRELAVQTAKEIERAGAVPSPAPDRSQ